MLGTTKVFNLESFLMRGGLVFFFTRNLIYLFIYKHFLFTSSINKYLTIYMLFNNFLFDYDYFNAMSNFIKKVDFFLQINNNKIVKKNLNLINNIHIFKFKIYYFFINLRLFTTN